MGEIIGHTEEMKSQLEAKRALLSTLLRERKLNEFSTKEMIEEGIKLKKEIESLEQLLGPQNES